MSISRIIAVENNLANILVEAWEGVFQSYMTRLLIALKAGNNDAATKIVDTFTLDAMLNNLHKSLDAYSHMAFKYGTQQINSPSSTVNDLHKESITLFRNSITQNVLVQVKKASQKVIDDFNKVKKYDSILNEFKSFASNVTNAAERNLRMATQLHTSRLSAYGFTAEANLLNITSYVNNAQLDTKLCPICRVVHGRIFQVSDARSNLQKILQLKDPDRIKEYAPWPDVREAENISRMSADELVLAGWSHPPFHANCLIGYSQITSSSTITSAFKHWFEGEVITIVTSGNKKITVTPNHPILSRNDWKAAKDFIIGEDVACCIGTKWPTNGAPNNQQMPTTIKDIFDSFTMSRGVQSCHMPRSSINFHGDIPQKEVHVVTTNRELSIKSNTLNFKFRFNGFFNRARGFIFNIISLSFFKPFLFSNNMTVTTGKLRVFNLINSLKWSHISPFNKFSGTFIPDRNIISFEKPNESSSGISEDARKLYNGNTGEIRFDNIVSISRDYFCDHVYNLETEDGWFASDTIITHNCRCIMVKIGDVPHLSMEAKPSSIESGANRKKYIPNKWDFISTGLNESPEVLAAWERAFNTSPMQLLARLVGEPAGVVTRDLLQTRGFIAKLNQRDLEFEVNKSIFGSTHPIGFKGSISLETKSAVLDTLEFAEVDAAKAVDVLSSSIKGFEQAGIEVVNINANVGQGSFALARLGWCPRTAAEWKALKDNYLYEAWGAIKEDVPPLVKNTVTSILATKDPQAIWELADIGYQYKGKGLGQTLLEDTQWWGALDLKDTSAMHRYHTFIE